MGLSEAKGLTSFGKPRPLFPKIIKLFWWWCGEDDGDDGDNDGDKGDSDGDGDDGDGDDGDDDDASAKFA